MKLTEEQTFYIIHWIYTNAGLPTGVMSHADAVEEYGRLTILQQSKEQFRFPGDEKLLAVKKTVDDLSESAIVELCKGIEWVMMERDIELHGRLH